MNVEIMPTYDGNALTGYIAKGHIEVEVFEASIQWQWNEDFVLNRDQMEHTTLRCIPAPPGERKDFSFYYAYSPPGRGAFKATVIWF